MTFDAGSVTGSLHFDLSEYTRSMIDAESLMQAFPAIVLECIENPMLAAIEVFKEAADQFIETIDEVGQHAKEIGLDSEKAGVTVKWFDDIAAAAETVDVHTEQLSTGLKFLQRNAADAVNGNHEAAKSFSDIGISTDFLRAHLNDTQGLFEAVHDRISGMGSASEKTAASMNVMGRSGSDLLPVFSMTKDAMDGIIQAHRELGAEEDEASARAGKNWGIIQKMISDAWDGIKKAFAEPILEYLGTHLNDVRDLIEGIAGAIKSVIPLLLDVLEIGIKIATATMPVMLLGLNALASVSDALGLTKDLALNIDKSEEALNKIVFDVDPKKQGDGGSVSVAQPADSVALPDLSNAESPDIGTGGGYGRGSRDDASGNASQGGGRWDGYSGILEASLTSAQPSFYLDMVDAFRPLLFEIANAITSANISNLSAPTDGSFGESRTASPSASAASSVRVEVGPVNVAGLDAASTASQIAAKIAPQIHAALAQQQQAADAAARHSSVQRAVVGGD